MRKKTKTYPLTTRQQELAQKPRKAKTRKAKGVKTSGSEGAKPGLVPGAGRGRRVLRVVPTTMRKRESIQLPDSSESSDTDEESEEGSHPPPHSLQESKSDQFALSPVIPPQGASPLGDVTTVVTDTPVSAQDPSPVPNDDWPSSSTPVNQEGTAAKPVDVSVEVHVVPDVSESPLGELSRMSLGSQTGSALSHQGDPPQPPSRDVGENAERHLTLDPARPLAELVGWMHTHLSPTRGFASGGFGVPPLSGDDLVVLEGWINKVGLTDLPTIQPKQVACSGVRILVQALKGTVIHLVQSEDDESATSDMEASDSSLPQDRSDHSSSPAAMDQDDVLGCGTYLDRGLASDAGAAPQRVN